jgi:hypothetical protein
VTSSATMSTGVYDTVEGFVESLEDYCELPDGGQ